MVKNSSIFNDVLGPVMTGPSSSHTAGPWRIGYTVGCLLDNITSLEVSFPKDSSYAGVYRGQRSDVAMIAGLLKLPIDSPQFKDAYDLAKLKGISTVFKIIDKKYSHPNTAILKITSGTQEREIVSLSTGGGTFKIIEIDGKAIDISGEANYLYSTSKENMAEIISILTSNSIQFEVIEDNECFFLKKINKEISQNTFTQLQKINKNIYFIPAVLPVSSYSETKVPFNTAKTTLEYCVENNVSFADAALLYEKERSGWTEKEVYDFAEYLLQTIEQSIRIAMSEDLKSFGFLKLTSKKMYSQYMANPKSLADIGILQKACIYATGIMEVNISMGVVVAGPTAGSCGVLGATLLSLYETGQYTRKEILDALLCAGLVGIFISNQATFAAEVCGCQAEIGAASSMTAAAVAHLLGASDQEICRAASMALQNMLGLICDPVAGSVDIPCVNRNSSGVGNAVISANMVVCGFDPYIPLDETIQTMFDVGKMLPNELKCTGLGGLCSTLTAQKAKEEIVLPV